MDGFKSAFVVGGDRTTNPPSKDEPGWLAAGNRYVISPHDPAAIEAAHITIQQYAREVVRLREAEEDIEALHAMYLAECTLTDEQGDVMKLDDATVEQRHHAETCALAHALYILRNSREERERIKREATEAVNATLRHYGAKTDQEP